MLEVSCLFLTQGMRGSAKLLWRYFSFFLISWVVGLGFFGFFFALSIFASKKGLGVMGVGWIVPALLCEEKGSIRRKDVGCLLASCMTPEIPKQYAGHRRHMTAQNYPPRHGGADPALGINMAPRTTLHFTSPMESFCKKPSTHMGLEQ